MKKKKKIKMMKVRRKKVKAYKYGHNITYFYRSSFNQRIKISKRQSNRQKCSRQIKYEQFINFILF